MFNKDPKKINSNDSGIDFSKSEMISNYFKIMPNLFFNVEKTSSADF